MQVTIRMIGVEQTGSKKNLELELEDGANVETALRAAAGSHAGENPPDLFNKMNVYLLNKKRASLIDTVRDGDQILIIRMVGGG